MYLTFIDAIRGWLVVDQGSHSGFMRYTGFRTTDGGQTWSTLSYPQSGPVLFINHLDGFSASGADGPTSGTFLTHDGGLTWARLAVSPAGGPAVSPLFRMPVFQRRSQWSAGGWGGGPIGRHCKPRSFARLRMEVDPGASPPLSRTQNPKLVRSWQVS